MIVDGAANVHWPKFQNVERAEFHEQESYNGHEEFLNKKIYLFGHQGAQAVEISPGSHKYFFNVDLPELLPESILTSRGKIEYKVQIFLDTPWQLDQKISVPFTIKRHEDLNKFLNLKTPLEEEEIDTSCCCCCTSKPVKVTVVIPYGGFAAGQDLPVKLKYDNKSGSGIEHTIFKLKRNLNFTCSSPITKIKKDTEVVIEHKAEGADGNEKFKTVNAFIPIPGSTIITNEKYCQSIQISYTLEVRTVFTGCILDMEFEFPIIIGSVGIGQGSSFNPISLTVAPNVASIPPYPPAAPFDLRKFLRVFDRCFMKYFFLI